MALNFFNPRYNRYSRRLHSSYPEDMFDSVWGPRSSSAMNINEPDWQIVDSRRSFNDHPYNDRPYNERPAIEHHLASNNRKSGDRPYNRSIGMYPKKSVVDKNDFQISLDVQHYQPHEITVRTENNMVVVNAKHEEKQDEYGYVARELTRRYELPDGCNAEDVTSTLFDDVLMIKAPRRSATADATIRQVQIQQQGPIRLNVNHE